MYCGAYTHLQRHIRSFLSIHAAILYVIDMKLYQKTEMPPEKLPHDFKVQWFPSRLPPFHVSMMESIKSIVQHNSFKMAEIALAGLEKALELCQYLSSEKQSNV